MKVDSYISVLPQDEQRKSLLDELGHVQTGITPKDLYKNLKPKFGMSKEQMSRTLRGAIMDGLVDVEGQGAGLTVHLTPFGTSVIKK